MNRSQSRGRSSCASADDHPDAAGAAVVAPPIAVPIARAGG
ncbi:hypothetical protein [Streptomyces sp. NPDC058371]|jgi:hypothetical protein